MNEEHNGGAHDAGQPVNQPDAGVPGGAVPAGDDQGIEDIKISHTGSKSAVIIVFILIIAGAIYAWMHWQGVKAERERHEKVKKDFQAAHVEGYMPFWETCRITTSEIKTNQDMIARLKKLAVGSEEAYGRYIREKCLPHWESALPLYKGVSGPDQYNEVLQKLVTDVEAMQKVWKELSVFLEKTPERDKYKKQVSESGNKWLAYQQGIDEKKSMIPSDQYVHLMQCILGDKVLTEINVDVLQDELRGTCSKDPVMWYARIRKDCYPVYDKLEMSSDDLLKSALKTFATPQSVDQTSVFGVTDCIKKAEEQSLEEHLTKVTKSWVAYLKDMHKFDKMVEASLAD